MAYPKAQDGIEPKPTLHLLTYTSMEILVDYYQFQIFPHGSNI